MIATFFRVAVRVPIEMKLVIDFFFFQVFDVFFFQRLMYESLNHYFYVTDLPEQNRM